MSEDDSLSQSSFEQSYGDVNYPKYNDPHPNSQMFPSISSEYKVSYPPSMETQIRKLRLSMEAWKEMILCINSVLLWDKSWYPSAIIGGSTLFFMIIWIIDPNILAVVSIIGLVITIGDYALPVVAPLFKFEAWTTDKQKQFEEICTNIILYKTKTELLMSSYCRMRVTNPKLYFSVTIFTLCLLAWIGSTLDNLFITYVVVTFLLLLPGMQYHGMLNKGTESFSKLFNDLVENAKSRVTQKKLQ